MNRRVLLSHLRANGCALVREGARHSWWMNTDGSKRSSIPRHAEISNLLARKICRDLGVTPIG